MISAGRRPPAKLCLLLCLKLHLTIYILCICIYIYIFWLVVSTPLKNMKVNGNDYSIYKMENKNHVCNHPSVIYHNISNHSNGK